MGYTKIRLDKSLMEKVEKYASLAGYSSKEEFVIHCLEREIAKLEAADAPEEVENRLRGLGYIS